MDVFKYGVNIIFRSYSVLTTLSQKIELNPALEFLGFKSLKEFYTPLLLLLESLLQRHGFFDLEQLNISLDNDPQRFKEQKIKDLINNVIKHASFDRNFLESQYQKMRTASSQENFISFNSFNPFLRKPLLKISKTEFLCPDPQCLLAYAFWGLSSELRNQLKDKDKKELDTEMGNALEGHFKQFGLQPAKPKDSGIKKETPSRADFFIKTERGTYIIEVKNSLGLRSPLFEPKELLKIWARTWHAYNQCMASQESETAHFVIVVGETILLEATTFFLFAHHAKKMDLQKISLVSASLFESLICSKDLDKFVDLQKERAENFIQNPIYENLIKWIESEQDFVVANNQKLEEYYVPIRDELVPRRLSEFLENLSPEQETLS
jgi:hypothetical protein